MKSERCFYTQTLADLYYKQGYYDDAIKGYTYLLDQEPGRDDYARGLQAAEKRKRESRKKELVTLVKTWVDLLQKENFRKGDKGV